MLHALVMLGWHMHSDRSQPTTFIHSLCCFTWSHACVNFNTCSTCKAPPHFIAMSCCRLQTHHITTLIG
jgi:hypothetical protein